MDRFRGRQSCQGVFGDRTERAAGIGTVFAAPALIGCML